MNSNKFQEEITELNRSQELKFDFFGNLPTAEIEAVYKNGKFIDLETGNEVVLKDDSHVKIKTLLKSISNEDFKRHANVKHKKVLPVDSFLIMKLPIKTSVFYFLKIKTHEPLIMVKKGNKKSICMPCAFSVVEIVNCNNKKIENYDPIESTSLNQIFTQASMKFSENYKSHTANIYNCTFLEDTTPLEGLRF